jgi:hypothetical protein
MTTDGLERPGSGEVVVEDLGSRAPALMIFVCFICPEEAKVKKNVEVKTWDSDRVLMKTTGCASEPSLFFCRYCR